MHVSPRESFCNYLHSDIEHLEEREFLTFRNEMKLLTDIQCKAEECKRQVTTSQHVTTFQLPQATQPTAGREYMLTISDSQPVSVPVVQPAHIASTQPATVIGKVQQPQGPASVSVQPMFYAVVDDQQPVTSRQLIYSLSTTKTANLPSVAAFQQEEGQHNTSKFPVYCSIRR